MRKLLLATIVLFHMFLASCSLEEEISIPEVYRSEILNMEYTQIDYDITALINVHRASLGLIELNMLDEISAQATSHSIYMVDEGLPSHDYFYLRSANLKKTVNAKAVSENVGYGFSTAETFVNAWIESDQHRKNIENPDFTDIGISTKKDLNNKIYITNMFIER